jgi:inner membrane protein
MLVDTTIYLHYHRHLTHAIPMLPLMAALVVGVVALFRRLRKPAKRAPEFHWGRAYLLALAGVASHLLLDWTNVYGIRLALPFFGTWYRLDITSVIDLWIWLILGAGTMGVVLTRLVSGEMGARNSTGRAAAAVALTVLLAYEVSRYLLHQRAIDTLEARLYPGGAPVVVAAMPRAFNPLRWNGLVRTATSYSIHDLNLAAEFNPDQGRVFFPQPQVPAMDIARQTETFRVFLDFSAYPYWRVSNEDEPAGAVRVEAIDLRFGTPWHPRFFATAIIGPDGRVIRSWFDFGAGMPEP